MPERIILILNCNAIQFSRVDDLADKILDTDTTVTINIDDSTIRKATITGVIPTNSPNNRYPHDIVFAEINDNELFEMLCNLIGNGTWYEDESICETLQKRPL